MKIIYPMLKNSFAYRKLSEDFAKDQFLLKWNIYNKTRKHEFFSMKYSVHRFCFELFYFNKSWRKQISAKSKYIL